MARLKAEHKIFIVQRLACFDLPSVVAAAVKEEFGVDVSRQAIEAYDPTKRASKSLSDKLRKLFEETRKSFLDDTSGIAISHKAVRLRTLQRMAEKAENMGNIMAAKDLLEQAAKEMGGAYGNKRVHEVTGKDGKPIETNTKVTTIDAKQLSTETLKELLRVRGDSTSAD